MKRESELVDAASAFDAELESYRRSGELFVKTPLDSVKHLERANATLAEIAASEERLQHVAQRLVGVLATARKQQEELAAMVVAHVPAVQAKNTRLGELMTELSAVAAEVGVINATLSNGAAHTPRELTATVLALSARSEALAKLAHAEDLEELATQAHALHQRLAAIAKKLGSS